MTIEEKSAKEELVLYINGRIDASTAPELEKFISDKLEGLSELILDFTEVEYISSAGLRVLLSAYKSMDNRKEKGTVTIRGANREVEDTLYITGFMKFLNVEGTHRKREDSKRNASGRNKTSADAEQPRRKNAHRAASEIQGR